MTDSPWSTDIEATPQAAEDEAVFFVGDIVRLKSCRWTMTVLAASAGSVAVAWFDAEGNLMTWAFPDEALVVCNA